MTISTTVASAGDVTILAIERVKSTPREDGSQILAFLDIVIPDMKLTGCTLTRMPGGNLRFTPPSLPSKKYNHAAITITNSDLYGWLLNAAVRAWQGLNADEEAREERGQS